MSFIIKIEKVNQNENSGEGILQIGAFIEHFDIDFSYWSREKYEQQWKEGLERLLHSNPSCLVTHMGDPKAANFNVIWPMWRENDTVYIQNRILFLDQIDEPFDEGNVYKYIDKRISEYNDEDDEIVKIEEHAVDIKEIERFLRK